MPKNTQLNASETFSSTQTLDRDKNSQPATDTQQPSEATTSAPEEKPATDKPAAEKSTKRFQMPHLLWLMLIILGLVTLAGYIVPAGQFQKGPDGTIDPNSFTFLEHQTPVSPLDSLMMLLGGAVDMAPIAFAMLMVGANVHVVIESKAFENLLNTTVYRLQDKSTPLLISGLFCLMVYLGGFAGSDALIAIVPIGVLFARKLGLDGIVAISVTTFAALIGFGTGPQHMAVSQMLIGLPPYSGFGVRLLIMNGFMLVGLAFVLLYVRKIQKDPTRSPMWAHGWRPFATEADNTITADKLRVRSVAVIVLFIAQFLVIVAYSLFIDSKKVIDAMFAVNLVSAIVIGKVAGFKWNDLANVIVRGMSNMAFVAVVIGMAGAISGLLAEANIIDTIVYGITLPLHEVGLGWSAVLMVLLFAVINFIIPSTAAKAAILIPLLAPVATALGMHHQLALQAFQLGDGFTNLLSPVLAWLVGSCATAEVPYFTWVRWVAPKVGALLVLSAALMLGLTALGWTGGVA